MHKWVWILAIVLAASLAACDSADDQGEPTPTNSIDSQEMPTPIGPADDQAQPTPTAPADGQDRPTPTEPTDNQGAPMPSGASADMGSYTIMNETTGTRVIVTVENGVRRIMANGLPDHETGEFPNPGNPNSIGGQDYVYTFPAEPTVAAQPTFYNVPQLFGIAINGVRIDPFAAEWYQNDPASGWQLAALANPLGFDEHNAHVQPNGAYHYHGAPMALLTTDDRPELIGFAGDGFPIYGPYSYMDPADPASEVIELAGSYQIKNGTRPGGPGGTYVEDYEYLEGLGHLDQCNGRTGVTPEYPDGAYYYVATLSWPFFGRCFTGALADSFVVAPAGGGPAAPGGGPPVVDFEAAAAALGVTVQTLIAALGNQCPPDFATAAGLLGISEAALRDVMGAPPAP